MRFSSVAWVMATAVLALGCGGNTTVADGSGGSGSGGASQATGSQGTGSQATGTASTGSGTGFGACSGPGQCVLLVPGCCGVCGQATLADFEPVNEGQSQAFFDATCTEPGICPDCPFAAPDPNLYAYCDGAQCQEADLRTTDLAACNSPGDCVLRSGTGCCTCDGEGWVAINVMQEGALADQVCEPQEPCPACEPQPPPELIATCSNGQCVVEMLQPGG